VDVTFWSELGNRKLDQYKLSETPIAIQGAVSVCCQLLLKHMHPTAPFAVFLPAMHACQAGFSSASKYEELGSALQVLGSSFNTGAGSSTPQVRTTPAVCP
jgi:hypothetical protein